MWNKIKSAIGSIAPWIATTLGGPLAGTAVKALTNALGLSEPEQQTPETILAAIQGATPDQFLALKKAENEHEQFMLQLGFDNISKLEEIASEDRASARAREIALHDNTPKILAFSVTFGFFALLAVMLFVSIPEGSQTILNIMTGSLGTAWISIVVYYFGSSAGSARKTDLLAAAQPVDTTKLSGS